VVFAEPSGSFAICWVCGWEDDDIQLRHPGMTIGANGDSLWQEQRRILLEHPVGVQEASGYLRDPQWRPLRPRECVTEGVPQTGREYFDAFVVEPPTYYWLEDRQVTGQPDEGEPS
jgi:hypothetical protein